jgi:hypothetical protein
MFAVQFIKQHAATVAPGRMLLDKLNGKQSPEEGN